MIKEKVLKIEHQPVFDKYAVKITYQNEEILKRGEFEDCGIRSISSPDYSKQDNIFYILGLNPCLDSDILIVNDRELQYIYEKVNEVNEKYGIIKRWRANKREYYYYIGSEFYIYKTLECYTKDDNKRYEFGNYFQTGKEAQKVLDSVQWKDLWKDVREDKLQFGV